MRFFGGRTEGFKQYHKCSDTEIFFYYDIVSLYPTVIALDDYAVGFGHYVNLKLESVEKILKTNKFLGIIKVDIEPPKKLHIPVLPDRKSNKLIFDLTDKKEKEYTSVELKYAISKGYKITKIYRAIQFKELNGLMKEYVEFFIKIKIENNKK